jgi:hypothetical protein
MTLGDAACTQSESLLREGAGSSRWLVLLVTLWCVGGLVESGAVAQTNRQPRPAPPLELTGDGRAHLHHQKHAEDTPHQGPVASNIVCNLDLIPDGCGQAALLRRWITRNQTVAIGG